MNLELDWTYISGIIIEGGSFSHAIFQVIQGKDVKDQRLMVWEYFSLEDKLFGLPIFKKLLETKEENQDRVNRREEKREETVRIYYKISIIGDNRSKMRAEKMPLDLAII